MDVLPCFVAELDGRRKLVFAMVHIGSSTLQPGRLEKWGIRDILEGLLDEGPVFGISSVTDARTHVLRFLGHAKKHAAEIANREVIPAIRAYYEEAGDEEIVSACEELRRLGA